MLYYLHNLASEAGVFGALNVFKYVTFRAMGAALTSLLFCLIFGPVTIRVLRRLKMGQPLRGHDEVHKLADLHSGKKGTPTMGGLLILTAVTVSCLLWAIPVNRYLWLALGSLLYLGVLGFFDDYAKITQKKSAGIPGRVKLMAQFVLAVFVSWYLGTSSEGGPQVRQLDIPFMKEPLITDMGWWCIPFFALVILGSSNAVNLTDGLDGLAAGCTVTVAIVYFAFSYVAGNVEIARHLLVPHIPGVAELAVFCAALVGAGLGFLWFNCHPAQVFMGDTGSLAIGGALGVVAICTSQEVLLILAGGVFVMEAGSVLLQVASFKLRGKRIFLMSPIHHHFELKGWNESTVTIRFWILSLLCALLALSTLKLR